MIGAKWTHDNGDFEYEGSPKALASSVVVPGRALLGDFARFSAPFTCNVCLSGSAVRQCAACQILLCAECTVRCELDHDSQRAHEERATYPQSALRAPTCAFAMCVECDDAVRAGGGDPLSDKEVLDELLR